MTGGSLIKSKNVDGDEMTGSGRSLIKNKNEEKIEQNRNQHHY